MQCVHQCEQQNRPKSFHGPLAILLVCGALAQPFVPPTWAIKAASHLQDIRVTDDAFSYQMGADGGQREYHFGELAYVQATGPFVCYGDNNPQPEIDKSLSPAAARASIIDNLNEAVTYGEKEFGRRGFGQKLICLPLYWEHKDAAARFASAVNRMIWENSAEVKAQQQQQFEQKIAAWRAAGSKVEVPEEAQRHFVIAQQAFEEKNFQHQAEELSAALDVYPTWPAEQFDDALVLGELNRYSEAIQHMRVYLELSPEASDAERAKQQIWIWQDKLQTAQASLPAEAARTKSKKR